MRCDSAIDLVRESYEKLAKRDSSHELLGFVKLSDSGFAYVQTRFDEFKERFSGSKDAILLALSNYTDALKRAV